MKIATHVLLFNQEKWILKYIEAVGKHVDKIYVSYSELPWNYNKEARHVFKNNSDLSILDNALYKDKIEVIEGVWDLDEDQRNSCLDKAKQDGMDFLLIIDADEFYRDCDLKAMIEEIKHNPQYDYYTTPWVTFWKDFDHIIESAAGTTILGYPEIAVNLKTNHRFVRCRRPSGTKVKQLNYMCYHASYVLTDDECWSKINTWGHAHQFDTKKWYDNKWVNWDKKTENLHPISPTAWKQALEYNREIPNILNSNHE
jgi:hypothetical protein